uniref:Uncharacterized protein n=1 Tax=Fundulus heteroclitus TaxID=8078 RepID=A0A3Q2QQ11_FUNHE
MSLCQRGNQKPSMLMFLHVEYSSVVLLCVSEDEHKAEFYKLSDTETDQKVCLATGFTRHNLLKDRAGFNETEASQIVEDGKPTGIYNQVAVLNNNQACGKLLCVSDVSECLSLSQVLLLFADEMVNLASLTVFGLRVIFMKTVVFNVLMTLRLWISQCEYRPSEDLHS